MRYLTAIAVFLTLVASMPLQAQRGGGHGSSGHGLYGHTSVGHGFSGGHSGFAGHGSFGGHASGGNAFGGVHSGSHSLMRSSHAPLTSRGLNSRNFNRNRNLRVRNFGFRNNCFGFRCGRGFGFPWVGGAFDPYWWWDSGSSYDQDQQEQSGLANQMNEQSLEEQRMRQQDDQDAYSRAVPPSHQAEPTDIAQATVLVFRDQHKQEVQNYAIVGPTLWNFAPQHTEKISLSALDLPATTKANDERGVDFRLPGASEGQ